MMHRLRHLFGWNTGTCYSWWDSDTGKLMSGFRCAGCDTIQHVSETAVNHRLFQPLGTRPCTCHPDDDPPNPCPRKYALDECRLAHMLSMQGNPIRRAE